MKPALSIQQEKKLVVTFHLEAGCLGPQGESHIVPFCHFAQARLNTDSGYLVYNIVERTDKNLPEVEYSLLGKTLTQRQVQKYLMLFDQRIASLEQQLSEQLTTLIHEYRNR